MDANLIKTPRAPKKEKDVKEDKPKEKESKEPKKEKLVKEEPKAVKEDKPKDKKEQHNLTTNLKNLEKIVLNNKKEVTTINKKLESLMLKIKN